MPLAVRRALSNRDANRQALSHSQPDLLPKLDPRLDLQWFFGRDGCLTAIDSSDQWLAGCSIPHRAAAAMLRSLQARAGAMCFVAPAHAAELRVALDRLQPAQAILAIIPDDEVFRQMLHCDDFASELGAHRLFLFAGADWNSQLRQLMMDRPGLPVPQQFIKTNRLNDDALAPLLAGAQECFSDIASHRAALLAKLTERAPRSPSSPRRALAALLPESFRLWEDHGHALRSALEAATGEITVNRLDPGDPATASPLAVAEVAARSDALIAINLSRSDAPNLLHPRRPWITWITHPRIPAFTATAPHDALILACPSWRDMALNAGWPDDRIAIGGWPTAPAAPPPPPADPMLAILADLPSMQIPDEVRAFSSHRLLWEMIENELLADPFRLGDNAQQYLLTRMKKLDIAVEGFNQARFLSQLVQPAFQLGIARALAQAQQPLALYGAGWSEHPALSPFARGEIGARGDFHDAIAASTSVLHVWPLSPTHPVHVIPRPVVPTVGRLRQPFLHAAAQSLRDRKPPSLPQVPAISSNLIRSLLPF